jgi:hypothetical protein
MYVNAKMIPAETTPGIGGGGDKGNGEGYLIHCKGLCKCHNVPSITI